MQPLRLAANPEAGLVHVLDRGRGHVVAHRLGEALEAFGTVLADPGDGGGGQMHAEQIGHQRGQTLLRQQLVVQQIEHEGSRSACRTAPARSPNRGRPPVSVTAAGRAAAAMRTVLGDDQRLRFGQVEHLPGDVAGGHRLGQRRATRGTGSPDSGRSPHRASRSGAASRPDGPSAHRASCRRVAAGCWSAAASSVRRWMAACRCCCCSARAGAPTRQSAPAMPPTRLRGGLLAPAAGR